MKGGEEIDTEEDTKGDWDEPDEEDREYEAAMIEEVKYQDSGNIEGVRVLSAGALEDLREGKGKGQGSMSDALHCPECGLLEELHVNRGKYLGGEVRSHAAHAGGG